MTIKKADLDQTFFKKMDPHQILQRKKHPDPSKFSSSCHAKLFYKFVFFLSQSKR